MKLLLDECLPRKLKRLLIGHAVATVPEMGWAGKQNGELLELAVSQFDVFITVDRNLTYQQNLEKAKLAVLVLQAKENRLATLTSLIPKVLTALITIGAGEIVYVE